VESGQVVVKDLESGEQKEASTEGL
jgi:hypothetical protein